MAASLAGIAGALARIVRMFPLGNPDDGIRPSAPLGFAAAQRKAFPDSVARKKLNDRFTSVLKGVPHTDNIYAKVE